MPHIVTSLMPQWASDAVTAVRTGWQVYKANRKRRSDPRGGEAMMANIFGAAGAYAFPSGWAVEKQEQVRHNRAWNYIAIRAIAEEIARHCPQAGYRRGPDDIGDRKKNKRLLSPYHRRKSLTSIQDHEEIEAVDSDHDLLKLMRNPNGPEVGYTFWYRLPLFMELTGENYWWKVRNRLGEVVELWNLFPQWVTPKPGRERLIDAYEIRPWAYGSNGVGMFTVPPEDIVAFRYPSALTMINGHSPIQSCSEWIDTAEAIDASRWYAFENGNHPGTLIELDQKVFGQKPVEKSDLNRFYAEYAERMGGREKHRAPLVMNPGMTAKPWSNTPAEMDYTASSDQNRDWVMAIHRVGKSIAGIVEDVNYASSVTATANFLQRTVSPKLALYGQVITEQLAAEFDPNLLVYWPDMTPDDPEQRNKDIETDAKVGGITPNEVRRLRGREPYEHGGDDPMLPASLVPMPWVSGEMMEQGQEWGRGDEQVDGIDENDPHADIWYAEDNADAVKSFFVRNRLKAGQFDGSKHPRGQPENAGQFGPGGGGNSGGSAKPKRGGRQSQPDPAAFRPSKPGERHKGKTPPSLPFKAPPPPQGKGGGSNAGSAGGTMSKTKFGDLAEAATSQLDMRNILPEGKRSGAPGDVAKHGSTLDREYDHSGYAFEVKACSTLASEYKAKPKAAEVKGKIEFAKKHGLKPATMIAVVDFESGQLHAYWRPGIGAFRLTESGENWNYMGSVSIEKPKAAKSIYNGVHNGVLTLA